MVRIVSKIILFLFFVYFRLHIDVISNLWQSIIHLTTKHQKSKIEKLGFVLTDSNQKSEKNDCFSIEHLQSFKNILIVGDGTYIYLLFFQKISFFLIEIGDFSFSLCVAHAIKSDTRLTVTCYPSMWHMMRVYTDIGFIVHQLQSFKNIQV